ncbi:MAG: S-layer homology domain-containing protein [Elainellaceae cyanobacterium]
MALSLGVGLSAPLVAPAQAQTTSFTDVDPDYWASDYISALADLDVLNGFPDGTFRPGERVTRAQFAAIVRQAFLASETAAAAEFVDVPANHWAAEAISVARSAGFLSGYPGNTFNPEQNISRAQVWVALTSGLAYTTDASDELSYYVDSDTIPDYARPGIAAATKAGIVVNYPAVNQLQPEYSASRADVAAFVYQALVQQGRAEPLTSSPYVASSTPLSWQVTPVATIPTGDDRMAFSGSGQRLVTLSAAGDLLRLWNTQTGEQLTEIVTDGETRIEAATINGAGTQVAAIVQTLPDHALELWLWDLETGEQRWRQPLGIAQGQFRDEPGFVGTRLNQVVFRPSGQQILTQVSLGFDAADRPTDIQLRLHDSTTGETLQTLEPSAGGYLEQFAFSPDGEFLAGVGFTNPGAALEAEQVLDLWQLADGTRLGTLRPDGETFGFADIVFTVDGQLRTLAQDMLYDIHLDTWEVRSPNSITRLDRITSLPLIDRQDYVKRLSPDGRFYFVRSDVAGTRLINTETGAGVYLEAGWVENAVFSADGKHLAIANQDNVQIFSQAE